MVHFNVPDDWGSYYRRCERCGRRYHESEGGCACMDDLERCDGYHGPGPLDGLFEPEDLTDVSGKKLCREHAKCDCCERSEGLGVKADEDDLVLCKTCWEEQHDCSERPA